MYPLHKKGKTMPSNHSDEKEAIEKATADAFIALYNSRCRTSFSVSEYSDAPDIRCKDADRNVLNLEITLTQDREGDIPSALDRSDHRSVESFLKHRAEVKAGRADPFDRVSCSSDVTARMVSAIQSKLQKDYGPNVALVVRHVSGSGWSWEKHVDQIVGGLNLDRNPFDMGIWVIPNSKDRIVRLV